MIIIHIVILIITQCSFTIPIIIPIHTHNRPSIYCVYQLTAYLPACLPAKFTFNCWQQQHITFIPCLPALFVLLSTIMQKKKKILKTLYKKIKYFSKTWKSKRSSIKMQTYAPRSPPMCTTSFIPLQLRTTTVNQVFKA